MDAAALLLGAGITVFSPMKDNNLLDSPGKKIGIVGLGGLGHVAVKLGKAFGHHVTVISTSPSKEKEAKELSVLWIPMKNAGAIDSFPRCIPFLSFFLFCFSFSIRNCPACLKCRCL